MNFSFFRSFIHSFIEAKINIDTSIWGVIILEKKIVHVYIWIIFVCVYGNYFFIITKISSFYKCLPCWFFQRFFFLGSMKWLDWYRYSLCVFVRLILIDPSEVNEKKKYVYSRSKIFSVCVFVNGYWSFWSKNWNYPITHY